MLQQGFNRVSTGLQQGFSRASTGLQPGPNRVLIVFLCHLGHFRDFFVKPPCTAVELIKVRMQVQEMQGRGQGALKYTNFFQAAGHIVKHEGARSLFNGFWITASREIYSYGLYFSFYYWLQTHPKYGFKTPSNVKEMLSLDIGWVGEDIF